MFPKGSEIQPNFQLPTDRASPLQIQDSDVACPRTLMGIVTDKGNHLVMCVSWVGLGMELDGAGCCVYLSPELLLINLVTSLPAAFSVLVGSGGSS